MHAKVNRFLYNTVTCIFLLFLSTGLRIMITNQSIAREMSIVNSFEKVQGQARAHSTDQLSWNYIKVINEIKQRNSNEGE